MKPKPIIACACTLLVLCLGYVWLLQVLIGLLDGSPSFLIGQSNYFGFVLRHSIETRSNTGFYCNLYRSTEAFKKFTCAVHITELPIFWPWINSHTCMDRYGTIIKMERIRYRLLYLMYTKVTSWCTQMWVCACSLFLLLQYQGHELLHQRYFYLLGNSGK